MLSAEEVRANAETYMQQFFKVVDKDKTETRWQSEWFGKFNLADVIRLTSKFTVAQLLAREDFSNRYSAGRPIAITELLYPLLQAYDSVAIKADVEFGGIDQKFNCLMGRELQQMIGQPRQQVFLMHLLVGTDGQQKMSKSLGNYVAITDTPEDMYGKVMSIPDDLLMDYFELLTDVSEKELAEFKQQLAAQSVNPMMLKKRLAREIVGQFHSAGAAGDAESHFEKVVQKKEIPTDLPICEISPVELMARALTDADYDVTLQPQIGMARPDIVARKGDAAFVFEIKNVRTDDLLLAVGLAKSRSEARRTISGGALEVDGKKVIARLADVHDGSIIRVGKRRLLRISFKKV
jgi:tyrosyl-tRNA synthetase